MQYLTEVDAIREAIAGYDRAKTLWLDTEVADYKTPKPKLSLIQVLDDSTDIKGDCVVVLDVLNCPDITDYFIKKIMFNSNIEKIFHNAKYDLQFLGKRHAKNVFCTLEMSKKIPYYLVPLPNNKLKTLAEKLCHFPTIDKTEQEGDWGKRPLTKKQLDYAKMDPVYVAQVHHRLLQLSQFLEQKPETEDISSLTLRYRQIEHRWKQLDTEIKHLKERLKAAMASQNISEVNGFRLSPQKRTTKTIKITQLAKVIQTADIQPDFSLKLTKEIQKELADIIEQLPVEEQIDTILQLKVTELNDEDLPF